MSSAMDMARTKENLKNVGASTELAKAQTKTQSEQQNLITNNAKQAAAQTKLLKAQIPA